MCGLVFHLPSSGGHQRELNSQNDEMLLKVNMEFVKQKLHGLSQNLFSDDISLK